MWTPFAELTHYESVTRRQDTQPANPDRAQAEYHWMRNRWGPRLVRDPAYNPNLTLDREDYSLSWPPRADRAQVGGPPIERPKATDWSGRPS